MSKSKDLFDESTMSFGEHLEILRVHLWKALIGLVICVGCTLFVGKPIMQVIQSPIEDALQEAGMDTSDGETLKEFDTLEYIRMWWNNELPEDPEEEVVESHTNVIEVTIAKSELARALHEIDSDQFPEAKPSKDEPTVTLKLQAREFLQFREAVDRTLKPVTLSVQEAFMTYLKVAFVAGLVVASPWVFYQMWLFVAAGLYPHERSYVYIFLPMSTGLFLTGILFCFFIVFPFVLDFLLGFNVWLGLTPNIRMSEWISFAISLPLMFGVSFQLPLVMLFLERISVFEADDYRQKRRMAVLVIAVLSMMLTPADPTSMIAMMVPLLVLYELGILMCRWKKKDANPYEEE
ncbi:MAG: twin-arginine translocase subunit TatC [Planctomycetaceae bacterium]|nr:twin-arginine translocase subunit TatC [Planctomycetaceae bacterium]